MVAFADDFEYEDDYDGLGGVDKEAELDAEIEAIRREDPDWFDRMHYEGSNPALGCLFTIVFGLLFWAFVAFCGWYGWEWIDGH